VNITFNRVTNKTVNNHPKFQPAQTFQGSVEKETQPDVVQIADKKITRQQKEANKIMARQQKIVDRVTKRAEKFQIKLLQKLRKNRQN
jgi:hypothetical protein